jgi:hypothetical protein
MCREGDLAFITYHSINAISLMFMQCKLLASAQCISA